MKKLFCLFTSILLCFTLVACEDTQSANTPKEVVTSMFESYQKQDFKALDNVFDGNANFEKDLTLDGVIDVNTQKMAKMFIDKMTDVDFKVLDETISSDGKTATVTVKITSYNIAEKLLVGMKDAVPLAMQLAFSKENPEKITAQVFDALFTPIESCEKNVVNTVNINMVLDGNEWKISSKNLELINSITGGFMDVVGKMNFLQ